MIIDIEKANIEIKNGQKMFQMTVTFTFLLSAIS